MQLHAKQAFIESYAKYANQEYVPAAMCKICNIYMIYIIDMHKYAYYMKNIQEQNKKDTTSLKGKKLEY